MIRELGDVRARGGAHQVGFSSKVNAVDLLVGGRKREAMSYPLLLIHRILISCVIAFAGMSVVGYIFGLMMVPGFRGGLDGAHIFPLVGPPIYLGLLLVTFLALGRFVPAFRYRRRAVRQPD